MAFSRDKVSRWRQLAIAADYLCNAPIAEAKVIKRLLYANEVTTKAKGTRRTPAGLALETLLCAEVRLTKSAQRKGGVARCV